MRQPGGIVSGTNRLTETDDMYNLQFPLLAAGKQLKQRLKETAGL